MRAKRKLVLLVRLDKIGDLVSTLPVDQALASAEHPSEYQTEWVIAKGLGFLAETAVPARKYSEVSLGKSGAAEFRALLQDKKPDMVVFFYAPWWASYEAFRAGVALRVGRKSQWHSLLFFNHSLRQSRSQSERHEADYNFELAQFAVSLLSKPSTATTVTPTPVLHLKAPMFRQLFEKFNVQSKNYIVVHPGMAGSALNWPISKYQELVALVLHQSPHMKVLITGTTMDSAWTKPVIEKFKNQDRVISAVDCLSLRELLFILENAKAVIAPSTGVAHLAASLGTPTRAIYSPVLAHASRRWGPRGQDVTIFEPNQVLVGHEAESMSSISPHDVLGDLCD